MLNEYQQKLYNDLVYISHVEDVNELDGFCYKDDVVDGVKVRIFGYHKSISPAQFSYHDNALEARGTMFEIDDNGNAVNLLSLPFQKFFNAGELEIKLTDLTSSDWKAFEKLDGSMISTYLIDNKIKLKTKMSINSEQAAAATKLLYDTNSIESAALRQIIARCETDNCTLIMEYTSPSNQIVLLYNCDQLRIIGMRSRLDGTNYSIEHIKNTYCKNMAKDVVDNLFPAPFNESAEDIPKMKDIEGFVFRNIATGQLVKVKTEDYVLLHQAKDSVLNVKKLLARIANGDADDLMSLFTGKLRSVSIFVQLVDFRFRVMRSDIMSECTEFYTENEELSRKDFAIKAKQHFTCRYSFSSVMNLYQKKLVDWNVVTIKHIESHPTLIGEMNQMLETVIKLF